MRHRIWRESRAAIRTLLYGWAVGALMGCGGGGGEGEVPVPPAPGAGGGGSTAVAPVITAHPTGGTYNPGQTATFTVVASGTAPLTYQWRRNGSDIADATSASYTTAALTGADHGAVFSVRVANAVDSAISNGATLAVTTAPPTPTARITSVHASNRVYFALMADGELFATGRGSACNIGDGDVVDRETPVSLGRGWAAIAGRDPVLALKADGSLWGWGSYTGDGSSLMRCVPTRIGDGYKKAHSGEGIAETHDSIAVKQDGTLWFWGSLGINALVPTQIGTDTDWADAVVGDSHGLALKTDGSLWSFGHNEYGQLGLGFTEIVTINMTPRRVGSGTFRAISINWRSSYAVASNGDLYSWGRNYLGILGDNTAADRASPMLIGTGFKSVDATNEVVVGLKDDGSVWAWGTNTSNSGIVGDGTSVPRTVPTKLAGLTLAQVSASSIGVVGIDAAGATWGWGDYAFTRDTGSGNFKSFTSRMPVKFDYFAP